MRLSLPFDFYYDDHNHFANPLFLSSGIPSLVLLDEVGSIITTDGRSKIPMDKAGIGFPWRNPLAQAYITLVPKSIRLMMKSQISSMKVTIFKKMKAMVGLKV